MKLSYKTKDQLVKLGFIIMIIGFIFVVGYSYKNCLNRIENTIVKSGIQNIYKSMEEKIK